MKREAPVDPLWFLEGGGEMAALARTVDWAATPVGPPERWPACLKTTLGTLFHSRHPMFLWWGPELVQFYNDAYRPSFGNGKHPRAMGQRGVECWPEIWPIIGPQIRDVMEHGKPSWNENQLVPIWRNGHLEDVYWTYGYSPVFGDDGRVAGTLVVCTETTQQVVARRQMEALTGELQSALQLRDEFLSVASHELRTPLTGLRLQVQSARRSLAREGARALPPERVSRLIDQTEHGLGRMSRLVEDMLDISRIRSGKLQLHVEPVDLARVVRDTVERYGAQLDEAGCALSLQLPEALVLQADRDRLEQVLTNLLTNALRYAPGAPLAVALVQEEGRARLSVQDAGPGIAAEDQARVFERFGRVSPATHVGGLGLGLYIVRELVSAHGGTVGLLSAPGRGTRFTVELPLA